MTVLRHFDNPPGGWGCCAVWIIVNTLAASGPRRGRIRSRAGEAERGSSSRRRASAEGNALPPRDEPGHLGN